MLSDGIFAIATTLAALEMRIPSGISDPVSAVAAIWRPLIGYGISFAVIAVFWLSSRDLFARLVKVTRPVTGLTLLLLWLVALIPVVVSGISDSATDSWFRLYASVMAVAGLVNAMLWTNACFTPGVMRPEVSKFYRWNRTLGSLALPLMFLPIMLLSKDTAFDFILPWVIVVALARRRLLPRYLRRKFPEERGGEPLDAEAIGSP